MALATYADLQAAIAGWLLRQDLTATIPDFVTLAEAQINRDVRHWRMTTRDTLTINARYVALPTDWVDTQRITTNASGYEALRLVSIADMENMRGVNDDTGGVPKFYAHVGDSFEFYPTPDASYTGSIVYTSKVPALSNSNTTNWLLEDAPDVYLYGALIQSAPYLVEDARITTWAGLYGAGVSRLNNASNAAKWSGTGLRYGTRRTS